MRHYTKILVWENKRRLNKLIEFRNLVIAHFDNSHTEWNMDTRTTEITPPEARRRINQSVQEVHSMIIQAGINPTVKWIPPAAIGGYVQNVNLILDIFTLDGFSEIERDHVVDMIDRAIGIYESNAKWARFRRFNPFYYIGLVFDFVSRLPFIALGKLGANQLGMEMSVFGRLIKEVLYWIQVAAALIAIHKYWDFWTPIKNFVRELAWL